MAKKSGIHIKPSKKGTFTAAASKHGKGVQEFARQVLSNKENYSPAMVKKANFARNAAKWKRENGGYIEPLYTQSTMARYGADIEPFKYYQMGGDVIPSNYQMPKKRLAAGAGMMMPYMQAGGNMPKTNANGDADGDMARGQIRAMHQYLDRLEQSIGEEDELEPWVNSKITLADDYLGTVADYLGYSEGGEEGGEMEEMRGGGSIPERYRNMGFTRVGQKKAGSGKHKWKVLAQKDGKYKVVQGGWRGMQDFSQHGNEKRRNKFWSRMGGKNSAKAKDPFSPLYWHKRFGTWEAGGPVDAGYVEMGGVDSLTPLPGHFYPEGMDMVPLPGKAEGGMSFYHELGGVHSMTPLPGYAEAGKAIPNNPGFKKLPKHVQKKILAKMEAGGKMPAAYARARFAAAGNEHLLGDYGYAQGGAGITTGPMASEFTNYEDYLAALNAAGMVQGSPTMDMSSYTGANLPSDVAIGQQFLGAQNVPQRALSKSAADRKAKPVTLYDYLVSQGAGADKQSRKAIASYMEIPDYAGTYDQNIEMLRRLQEDPTILEQITGKKPTGTGAKAYTPAADTAAAKSAAKKGIVEDREMSGLEGFGVGLGVAGALTAAGLSAAELMTLDLEKLSSVKALPPKVKAQLTRAKTKLIKKAMEETGKGAAEAVQEFTKYPKRLQKILNELDIAEIPGQIYQMQPGTGMRDVEAWKMGRESAAEDALMSARETQRMLGESRAEQAIANAANTRRMLGESRAEEALANAMEVKRMLRDTKAEGKVAPQAAEEMSMFEKAGKATKEFIKGARESKAAKAAMNVAKEASRYARETPWVASTLKVLSKIKEDGGPIYAQGGEEVEDAVYRDPDTTFENIMELLDPTGVSSYDDVYRNWLRYKEGKGDLTDAIFSTLGALPVVGKVGKAAKIASEAAKLSRAQKIGNALGKTIGVVSGVTPQRAIDYYNPAARFVGHVTESALKNAPAAVRFIGNTGSAFNRGDRFYNTLGMGFDQFTKLQDGGLGAPVQASNYSNYSDYLSALNPTLPVPSTSQFAQSDADINQQFKQDQQRVMATVPSREPRDLSMTAAVAPSMGSVPQTPNVQPNPRPMPPKKGFDTTSAILGAGMLTNALLQKSTPRMHTPLPNPYSQFGSMGYGTQALFEHGGWIGGTNAVEYPYESGVKFKGGGQMIRRADGSYSRRGLWDNIRANKGSGKKPTPEMLKQERKIRAAEKKAAGGEIMNVADDYNPIARMGGQIRENYPSEYEQGGELSLYDPTSSTDTISYNQYSSPKVEFKGKDHGEKNAIGTEGTPINVLDQDVEVYGGEVGRMDQNGFQLYGKTKNPITGKTFEKDMKAIAEVESKANRTMQRVAAEIDNLDPNSPDYHIRKGTLIAKAKGADKRLQDMAALTEMFTDVQTKMLDIADAFGVEPTELGKKIMGGKIPKAQGGLRNSPYAMTFMGQSIPSYLGQTFPDVSRNPNLGDTSTMSTNSNKSGRTQTSLVRDPVDVPAAPYKPAYTPKPLGGFDYFSKYGKPKDSVATQADPNPSVNLNYTPFTPPPGSPMEPFDYRNILPEAYAAFTNERRPVPTEFYQPLLNQSVQVTDEAQIQDVRDSYRAAMKDASPAERSVLAGRAAAEMNRIREANQRQNMLMDYQTQRENIGELNKAQVFNIGQSMDQQLKLEAAKKATRDENIGIMKSATAKKLQDEAMKRDFQVRELETYYRYDPKARQFRYMGPPMLPYIPTVPGINPQTGQYLGGYALGVPNPALAPKKTKATGGLVKAAKKYKY